MQERRKLERFELTVPARVFIESGSKKRDEYDLTTRDVSSAGSFLYSSQLLPKGAIVKMEFLICLDTLQKFSGDKSRGKVRVKGKVIRSDSNGIAIRFDSKYKITAFDGSSLRSGLS